MVFKDLPAGAEFYFGAINSRSYDYSTRTYHETQNPIKWMKTALNGIAIDISGSSTASFDYSRRHTGSNQLVRNHGHRLFFISSLCKYLNCSDTSWKETADGDSEPRASSSNGFLANFNSEDIKYLEKFPMTVNVPKGYTKQYGTTVTQEVFVGIPSLAQMGENNRQGTFGVNWPYYIYTWLCDGDTLNSFYRGSWVQRTGGDILNHIAPIIKIKEDAPIDTDVNGNYVIRVPEAAFEGDLAAFLGFSEEAAA